MLKREKPTEAWGVAGLILGILSLILIFAPYLGLPLAILAVVFYGIQKKHKPTGVGTAALVLGIIGIVINVMFLIFVVGVFAFLGLLGSSLDESDSVTIVDNSKATTIPQANVQQTQKVKSANISVDKVQIQLSNLYPSRVTVSNTGDVSINPKFDLSVTDSQGKKVCSGSPIIDEFSSIPAGQKKTGELTIMGCMFTEDGTYTLIVDLLDQDYNKLDSDSEQFEVKYWSQFDFG